MRDDRRSSDSSYGGGLVHSVVPIGGAPFVRPLVTMMQPDYDPTNQHHRRRASASIESTAIALMPAAARLDDGKARPFSSSPTYESSGFYSPSSSASSSPTSPTPSSSSVSLSPASSFEAAVRYSSALHLHTRQMWERERLSIERARLAAVNGTTDGSEPDSSPTSPAGTPASGLQKRSTLSGGMDALWRGRRRHAKNSASIA